MQDERIVGNLISKDSKATVVVIKTKNGLNQDESEALMKDLKVLLQDFDLENYHILGKAYFQVELVKQQIKEFIISTLISAFLVSLVFWWMMRKPLGVLIAIISMIMCLLVFVGMIGLLQIELDLLSALFPIIMIIVGVSDVVHLSNKYVDEYEKWNDKKMALTNTIKEIGLATFLTSFTTAIGFLSLMTSKIYPVKMFGFTAAIGVILAFVIVITFTSSFLAMLPANKIVRKDEANATWKKYLLKIYAFTKTQQRSIVIGSIVYTFICAIGIYLITTNVKIYDTLPKGMPVTKDFKFFEEKFAGFRPFELAILVKEPHKVDEWEVLQEINKIEEFIKTQEAIEGVSSVTAVYKTMNRAMNADRSSFYTFPSSEAQFKSMKRYIDKIPTEQLNVLVNADKTKARISAKIKDIGSDNIEQITQNIMNFVDAEVNKDLMEVRITGTGVIFDKNNEYIRQSLLSGLLLAFMVISLTMALLFRDWRMLIISIIPNVFPLLFGGAIMGFFSNCLRCAHGHHFCYFLWNCS
jgi:predicted RND superfamily exporter protein